jgi:hypothetical protein
MRELLRLTVFLVFLALSIRVAFARSPARRTRVNTLLLYLLCISGAAGLLQRDSWPFAAQRIFYHQFSSGHVFERWTLQVIDQVGRECEPDPHFAAPVTLMVLLEWLEHTYPRLSELQQQQVMSFLFARTREAAERAGRRPEPVMSRALYALAPPAHWALYTLYASDDFRRCVPYGGLRLYRDTWRPSERFRDRRRVDRHLVSEYRSP